ncbi:hypothetical protein HJG54_26105 [Leptolyngbya sp. NK1-12]|uniref:Uncharacterized protein n=1 Tax=Leptolyngbya sp. NK1-12 TaxID=2547451 RepID=A0AA96WIW4_9CYAN|nr:hypothetical protein [Leptolyngbya sp. NK1-12]MBF2046474.1 hypothetical protein [Elainella sp. C42_A2020_010]RNJ69857.1 MAG: hypothetical protein EDM05_07840 [Leptolyngbya sp. IPPAS B-1204]WNZ25959.1 hypothetical protein HJG54_26105 [Leptolyngbya sp. NK1-12]
MLNLISGAVARIGSFLNGFQVKRFLAVALIGFVVLTANVSNDRGAQAIKNKVDEAIHQNDSDRPKTVGEWKQEARETEGAPGERLQRIAKESKEAVKDWAKLYPDTAERSAQAAQD